MDCKVPKRLYKYRRLNNRTLDMILNDEVYFADPSAFNDPLDTRPSLEADVETNKLEDILRGLVERRTNAELNAAAKSLRYRNPRTIKHIRQQSQRRADQRVREIAFYSSVAIHDSAESRRDLLRGDIESELFRQFDRGIVSFAERSTCPLMWSHYGDQHRGVCIGYTVPARAIVDIHKVKYRGSRLVRAGSVVAMLEGCEAARHDVDEAVLLRKAGSWRYEREWRLFGALGLQDSPLEMENVIFGMRCTEAAKYAVMKAMEGRARPVKFHEIHEYPGKFQLKKRTLHYDDARFADYPRRAISVFDEFKPLTTTKSS